jgi:hypothetical protein
MAMWIWCRRRTRKPGLDQIAFVLFIACNTLPDTAVIREGHARHTVALFLYGQGWNVNTTPRRSRSHDEPVGAALANVEGMT